jgi:hypothetical protein
MAAVKGNRQNENSKALPSLPATSYYKVVTTTALGVGLILLALGPLLQIYIGIDL